VIRKWWKKPKLTPTVTITDYDGGQTVSVCFPRRDGISRVYRMNLSDGEIADNAGPWKDEVRDMLVANCLMHISMGYTDDMQHNRARGKDGKPVDISPG